MRYLAQPRVLKSASLAAAITALACLPRFSLWPNRPASLEFLSAVIFLCSIVLWGFVFAWHEPYTRRPVFTLKLNPWLFLAVTLTGVVIAVAWHLFLDPIFRAKTPEDYPADLKQWLALVLFSLAFNQLFLIFAPFAWLIRLLHKPWVAASLTVLFGVFVLATKFHSLPTPMPPALLTALLAVRLVMGSLAVWIYLRGGVLLSLWWTLLLETRNLPDCL